VTQLLTRYGTEWKNKNRLDLDASGGGRPLQDRVQWSISSIEAVQHLCNMILEKTA
jgi:hypothetical protein